MKVNRYRRSLEALDARDVPAAFSAHLSDGSNINGIFTTPEGVDPTQQNQQFPLTDLAVTRNNVSDTVRAGATVAYSNGALVRVTGVAQGVVNGGIDTISLNDTLAQDGSYVASPNTPPPLFS